MQENTIELKFEGIPASSGVVVGKAVVIDQVDDTIVPQRTLSKEEVKEENNRYRVALKKTKDEMIAIKSKMATSMGKEYLRLLDAYILIVDDPIITKTVFKRINNEFVNSEWALHEEVGKVFKTFERMEEEYFRERTLDIKAVYHKLLSNLSGNGKNFGENIPDNAVLVAHNLTPAETVGLPHGKIMGFITDVGGRTSHTAIVAQSLGIPAVVGLKVISQKVKNNDTVVVDGDNGIVWVNPGASVLKIYSKRVEEYHTRESALKQIRDLKAETLDGHVVHLYANMESIEELNSVVNSGAEGVGLYRTEFLYLSGDDLPSEDKQYEVYSQVLKHVSPFPVTIRTIDLGGDKILTKLQGYDVQSTNPFLGLRSIRFCLKYRDIFKTQLRAIFRATINGKAKIMFPMVSTVEEIWKVKEIIEEVKSELKEKNIGFNADVPIGTMIEVPAAALQSDGIARECDFLSIGTNDLIQYTLAVDRMNEDIAYLYEPLHPAVLRLVKQVINAGHFYNKPVSMCGEMAADSAVTELLIGLGLEEFSVSPALVPRIKQAIREVNRTEAKLLAEKVMQLSTTDEIQGLVFKNEKRHA
ncbi:MAG: phosphoenolpyruvate--protein phosphotransferase [Elusimicrobiota bacterium]